MTPPLDPIAYWNAVAQTASRTLTADQISELIEIDSRSWSHPAPVMPQWARDLRAAGLRTAILSNMPVPVRDYILRCPGCPSSTRVFPARSAFASPSRRSIDCLNKLGAKPSQVLFLDDREPTSAQPRPWDCMRSCLRMPPAPRRRSNAVLCFPVTQNSGSESAISLE
jgi:hypothetical protein